MSKLLLEGGDDHAEAAGKHLVDALTLEAAGRSDGAAYLAGYVVESSLKSLLLLDMGLAAGEKAAKKLGHRLGDLSNAALALATLPTGKTARYIPKQTAGHSLYDPSNGWRETLRYRAPGTISPTTAKDWLIEAKAVYDSTIVPMRLDGVI